MRYFGQLILTILLLATSSAVATEVTVRTLGGETIAGKLVSLDTASVTVGEKIIPRAQIATIALPGGKKQSVPADAVRVTLVDGTVLLATSYRVASQKASIELSREQTASVETRHVAQVRFAPPSKEGDRAWQRILDTRTENDRLVIRKAGTIDHLQGTLGEVTDEKVHFRLQERTFRVSRKKVFGMIYHHAVASGLPETIGRVTLRNGTVLAAMALKSTDQQLAVTTPTKLKQSIAWDKIAEIEYASSSAVYLSDLDPESTKWTPFFRLGKKIDNRTKNNQPRRDRSLEGRPLKLAGVTYAKGLAMRSRSAAVYRLPEQFTRFHATLGIDDAVRPYGHAQVKILGDDKTLVKEAIAGDAKPRSLSLDVTGVRRLLIMVDFGKGQGLSDHVDFCNARLTK